MARKRSGSAGRTGTIVLVVMLALPGIISASPAQTVVDAWDTVKAPPAPELKPVTADP